MKIESKDFKIKNIFSRRRYIIPDYQRNYSWTVDEEIRTFWDDFLYFLNKDPKTNFFIGPMVFKGQDINSSEFEVVDGQQRLITFSILMSVIIALFKENDRTDLSDGLKQYLIYKDERSNEQLVIETIDPHPFFQQKIFHAQDVKPSKESEELIEESRAFFERVIRETMGSFSENSEKVDFLEKIRDYVFDIDTVIIVSDDETDAFTIFETINTRGKDLSSIDLLKNHIFKSYPTLVGVEEPKKTWKQIVDNIKVNGDMFFNRFWASWISKVAENKLYRRFSDYVRDTKKNTEFPDTTKLLERLRVTSVVYRKITEPALDDWKANRNFHIYYHIKNINGLFNLKVHYPFFLALFEGFEDGSIKLDLVNKTLLLMENFHFVFTHIVSPRASGLDNKYSKFAIRLRGEEDKLKVIEDLKGELLEKMPKETEYAEKFKELNFLKNKDTIKFVLLRLEKMVDPSLVLDLELNSIDHLEPKSSTISMVNNIGNLFLLEEKFNNDKGNLHPFDISPLGQETVLGFLGRETKHKATKVEFENISRLGSWSEKEIGERTQKLARDTYNLFSKL